MDDEPDRLKLEIEHGRWLAQQGPEAVWGWSSPAGMLRAQRRGRWIAQAASLAPGMNVLEIGCGTGLFTGILAKTGASLTALDISEDLLKLAHKRLRIDKNVEFVNSSLERFEPVRLFDAVVGSSIIHHLQPMPALLRIRDLLIAGGRIAFAEPNGLNPQLILQKRVRWLRERAGDLPTEKALTIWEVRGLLESACYREIQVIPRDWLHPATPSSLIPVVTKMEPILESIPLLKLVAGSLYFTART